ncbi:rhodanese-like domain-containing protein [Gulosibacter chungangensis]|uniref:Rhodanese-like domain-containing protein n=1 Tax=Gulosibacter chungangensis TaxID=979746 RepID=A0A7J5B9T8_9MICO|nr:rhodanese-like domain-containing protein [Gulosibacter chungangensis]KAB1641444.1 rhodanese-like domain-containing protein [Gulosibacter chungangensis]
MRHTLTKIALPLAAGALALGLAACTSAPAPTEDADIPTGAIILDVRTPEEYAAEHLDGAKLLDFNAGEVTEAIPNLDPDADYLIYCRSGNRAGQAITLMEQAGFTSLTNLGSLEQAAETTALTIVR